MFRDGKEITTHTHGCWARITHVISVIEWCMGLVLAFLDSFFDIINEENFLSVFFFLPSVMPPMSASFVICKPNPPCVLVCGRDWDIILVVWWDGSPTRSYLESTAGAISCWFPDVMRLGAFIFFELNVHQRNLCQLNLDYIYRFDIQGQRPGSMAVGRITTVQVYSLFLSSAILI
jgi:hypothetical protein